MKPYGAKRRGCHRWRQRELGGAPSRYWDCVNPGCQEFCYDLKRPERRRMNHDPRWDVPCRSPKARPLPSRERVTRGAAKRRK